MHREIVKRLDRVPFVGKAGPAVDKNLQMEKDAQAKMAAKINTVVSETCKLLQLQVSL